MTLDELRTQAPFAVTLTHAEGAGGWGEILRFCPGHMAGGLAVKPSLTFDYADDLSHVCNAQMSEVVAMAMAAGHTVEKMIIRIEFEGGARTLMCDGQPFAVQLTRFGENAEAGVQVTVTTSLLCDVEGIPRPAVPPIGRDEFDHEPGLYASPYPFTSLAGWTRRSET